MSSSEDNTTNTANDASTPKTRPYTSLISLNGSFDLPMNSLQRATPDNVDSSSMIAHGRKQSKKANGPSKIFLDEPSTVEPDDVILNGIHTEDVQPKKDEAEEAATSLEGKDETI